MTAGNSCPLNDGAAAVLVMSEEKAKRLGLQPKARILASTVAAIRPEIMGLGPIPAIQALLKEAGMKIDEIDVVEINEAFAAQIVPCKDELEIPDEKLNPFGGAIALGHPFGMTGARIMTTLINDLRTLDGTYGIESMCVAGGMGQAMLIERLELAAGDPRRRRILSCMAFVPPARHLLRAKDLADARYFEPLDVDDLCERRRALAGPFQP